MSKTVIKVENLSKQYRLGLVGTGTLSHDLNRWWHLVRGKEDPYLKIGETNDRSSKGESEYVWALRDINFEVKEGEVLGIIGKNGAGKSTLLKLLSKVTAPTTGSIKAKGRIASLLEVGTGFHPELTGRENIYLNGTILGMTKVEVASKLDEIVAFAGVERYLDTPVKRYSSGMKVRLGFAVAAHLEPEILIVDEVLAVGDAEFQKKAIGKMQEVSGQSGRTVLFVSHNMGSVKHLCNRGLVLKNGVISFNGMTEDAIWNYLNTENGSHHQFPLDEREDRVGGHKFRFTKIELLNKNDAQINEIPSGEELRVKLYYDIPSNSVRNVVFRLKFVNKHGQVMFLCNNSFLGEIIKSLHHPGLVTFIIPCIPLLPGKYFIDILCGQKGEIYDEIEDAVEFSVTDGDFFKTGQAPLLNQGLLIKHQFKY
jgi:lipopolysaccharide transport system ATP-binding protein